MEEAHAEHEGREGLAARTELGGRRDPLLSDFGAVLAVTLAAEPASPGQLQKSGLEALRFMCISQ